MRRRRAAAGALAGITGAVAMNILGRLLRPGAPPMLRYGVATERVTHAVRHALDAIDNYHDADQECLDLAIHVLSGTVAGTCYALAAPQMPAIRAGRGCAFGVVLWALGDEGLVPLLGLSATPQRYPLHIHAYTLTTHACFGLVTDTLADALCRGISSARSNGPRGSR